MVNLKTVLGAVVVINIIFVLFYVYNPPDQVPTNSDEKEQLFFNEGEHQGGTQMIGGAGKNKLRPGNTKEQELKAGNLKPTDYTDDDYNQLLNEGGIKKLESLTNNEYFQETVNKGYEPVKGKYTEQKPEPYNPQNQTKQPQQTNNNATPAQKPSTSSTNNKTSTTTKKPYDADNEEDLKNLEYPTLDDDAGNLDDTFNYDSDPMRTNSLFDKSKYLELQLTDNDIEDNNEISRFLQKAFPRISVFDALGGYPEVHEEEFYGLPKLVKGRRTSTNILKNETGHCRLTDDKHLQYPKYIFNDFPIYTDYSKYDVTMVLVARDLPYIKDNSDAKYTKNSHEAPVETSGYLSWLFDVGDYNFFGKVIGCQTQFFNHHVGNVALKKHLLPIMAHEYEIKYQKAGKPTKCFDKYKHAPPTFRLYKKEECLALYQDIFSQGYQQRIKENPIQYIVKIGADSQRGEGIKLLDSVEIQYLQSIYGPNGELCGQNQKETLIAQKYIANPILLKGKYKFDFRIMVLISSVNPLVVYYHDGFLRSSIIPYDKHSMNLTQHLTNLAVAEKMIKELKQTGQTYDGKTGEQLEQEIIWTFDDFQKYMIESGKVTDPNWIENYLRPQFKKSIMHQALMAWPNFMRFSNTYEMYGFDYMIDEELNVWLIECNTAPIHSYSRKDKYFEILMRDMLKIQIAYYRSRMTRVFKMFKGMKAQHELQGYLEIGYWRDQYEKVSKNRLEPQYENMLEGTSWQPVINWNLPGNDKYYGLMDDECVLEENEL